MINIVNEGERFQLYKIEKRAENFIGKQIEVCIEG